MEQWLLISVIIITIVTVFALLAIWYKTSRIKKQVRQGTYKSKNNNTSDQTSDQEDYMNELRRKRG